MQLDSCKGSSRLRRRAELGAVVIVTTPVTEPAAHGGSLAWPDVTPSPTRQQPGERRVTSRFSWSEIFA